LIWVVVVSTVVPAALKANSFAERTLVRAMSEPNRFLLSQEIEELR